MIIACRRSMSHFAASRGPVLESDTSSSEVKGDQDSAGKLARPRDGVTYHAYYSTSRFQTTVVETAESEVAAMRGILPQIHTLHPNFKMSQGSRRRGKSLFEIVYSHGEETRTLV